jgi:1-piperideine-2-carboxylate/1-pyrroline-2-carboxylate reductase [NAD(P)H]
LQAGLPMDQMPTLAQVLQAGAARRGPVLFKSCGWAGWDLAAARLACPA